jgi:hypothetical protein
MVGIIQNSNKDCIEKIIGNTFNAIQDAYCYQAENALGLDNLNRQKLSRVVFPQKRDGTKRISEQELRLVFVEQLNKAIYEGWDVYYSVETPTRDTYSGFSNGETPKQDEKGRSGEFDLVIFNNRLERIALIEFKANNASAHDHKKDFIKLNNPKEGGTDVLRYLIEIVNAYDNRTLTRLHTKITGNESIFRCWSLRDGRDISEEIRKAK